LQKDDTKIIGENISVKNVDYGLAAFKKKAFINLTNVIYSNLKQNGLIVKINNNFYVETLILNSYIPDFKNKKAH